MTSPSEQMEANGVAVVLPMKPSRLPRAEGNVSRLSFLHVEQISAERTAVAEIGGERDESSSPLKEEIDALRLQLQEQLQQVSIQVDKARNDARDEARKEWEEELGEKLVAERAVVRQICEQFERQRTRYFADVEAEVVKLALGIAAQILQREVKLDPLLLAATVRVALERIEKGSSTVLRVPEAQTEMWRDILEKDLNVEVTGDPLLSVGECVLETSAGKAELGVKAQLDEIERGFFDLMQQRPVS